MSNVHHKFLSRLQAGGLTSQTGTQTATQPDNSPSTLSTLLGLGTTVLGMGTGGGGTVAGSLLGKAMG